MTTTGATGTRVKKSPFGQLLDAVAAEYAKIDSWNDDLQRDLPKKWEKHGDMILLPENSFTLKEWRMLGRNLWKVVAHCMQAERVGRKRRIEKDDYRSPHIELLYGQHGWVEHIDNGISYHYDVTKCMFSIGNINEKLRIASFDCKNEVIVDMFAGIGYFTLPYLVHAKAQLVHACEWNPDAIEALVRNVSANKVDDRCIIHEGDCRKVCPVGVADRVNLGLLPTARAYWLTACKALRSGGGVLHVHENVTSSKLKKSVSRQESTISNTDIIVGDSITIQYCFEDEANQLETGGSNSKENDYGKKRSDSKSDGLDISSNSTVESTASLPPKPSKGPSPKSQQGSSPKPSSKLATEPLQKPSVLNGSLSKSSEESKLVQEQSISNFLPDSDKDHPLGSSSSRSNDHVIDSSSDQHQDYSNPELSDSASRRSSQLARKDSLFEEVDDFYNPPINENFQTAWNSSSVDSSWKQFSVAAARRMRRFLNNLHDGEWNVTILRIVKVKSYAPRIDHIVLDLECRPLNLV